MYYIWGNIFLAKKLHILFLCSWFPSKVKPTSGDFVQRHAEAISTKHKVTVIHAITDKNLKKNIEIEITTINNIKVIIGYIKKFKNPILKYFYFIRVYKKCFDSIDNFDLVHLNVTYPKGVIALYLKWFKNKAFIITEHWTGYQFPRNKSIGFLRKKVTQLITKHACFICPVSHKLQKSMTMFGIEGNYHQVSNVVAPSFFAQDIIDDVIPFTITHISHMGNEHKNVIGIIKVVAKLQSAHQNIHFNLIGDNSKQYLNLINELDIKNYIIIDQIQNDEIAKHLSNSSVFVLFSNYENQPCVILESFACGVPVVSTDVGGIDEFFPEDYGYLVNPNDLGSLEKEILKIYNSDLIVDKTSMRNYASENFSFESVSSKYSELYYKCLKK